MDARVIQVTWEDMSKARGYCGSYNFSGFNPVARAVRRVLKECRVDARIDLFVQHVPRRWLTDREDRFGEFAMPLPAEVVTFLQEFVVGRKVIPINFEIPMELANKVPWR